MDVKAHLPLGIQLYSIDTANNVSHIFAHDCANLVYKSVVLPEHKSSLCLGALHLDFGAECLCSMVRKFSPYVGGTGLGWKKFSIFALLHY